MSLVRAIAAGRGHDPMGYSAPKSIPLHSLGGTVALLLFAVGCIGVYLLLRTIKSLKASRSSAVFMSMVSSPAILYASVYTKQAITGIGDGFAPVFFLALSICLSVIGVIGLAMKGLLFVNERLLAQRYSGDAKPPLVARYAAVVMIVVFGSFAAYLLWPAGQAWTLGRLLFSVAAVVGFSGALYAGSRLWR